MILKANRWVAAAVACAVFLLTGCGADVQQKELKPPNVYRDPQVYVTRAPTVAVTDTPTAGSSATPTTAAQLFADPFVDNEQFFMNEIEYLLDKIERKLEQIDINP